MIWDYGYFRPLLRSDFETYGRSSERLGITPHTSYGYELREPRYHTDSLNGHFGKTWRFPDGQFKNRRDQENKRSAGLIDVSGFHFDTDTWTHVAVWATNAPTQILMPNGEIYTPKPKHLIVFDNHLCQHRAGHDGFDAATRWFWRQGIYGDWTPNPKYLKKG